MTPTTTKTYAIILAGGVGSRFWPLSRELEPKQFLNLNGTNSLLQQTIERILPIIPADRVYVISNQQYRFQLIQQTSGYGVPEENLILEPKGKNTAPAIALAARIINNKAVSGTRISKSRNKPADPVMIILPADHYIKNTKNLLGTLKTAIIAAENGYLVTIGITPDTPHTGYGYIKKAKPKVRFSPVKANTTPSRVIASLATEGGGRSNLNHVFLVDRFTEKPDLKKAEQFLKSGTYLWNSGMFVWKTAVILDEIRAHLPQLDKQMQDITTPISSELWGKIQPISIDYGVLEHSKKVAVIEAKNLGWSDLGSWSSLNKLHKTDKSGNIIKADCFDMGSKNIAVFGKNRFISTIGLKDVVVVDTEDALLVCDKSRTEDVKKVVDKIKQDNRDEHFSHKTVKRPWGSYTVINTGIGFKVKLVKIDPHKRLSLQRHTHRSEHWVVVEGTAKITQGNKVYTLNSNESAYIPKQGIHRLENPSDTALKIVEVQCGAYLEENDIERIKDDFKRQKRDCFTP